MVYAFELGGSAGPQDDLNKLWSLISELSEQLSQNRAVTAGLQAQVAEVKVRPVSSLPLSGYDARGEHERKEHREEAKRREEEGAR
jgi:hypothetical protein